MSIPHIYYPVTAGKLVVPEKDDNPVFVLDGTEQSYQTLETFLRLEKRPFSILRPPKYVVRLNGPQGLSSPVYFDTILDFHRWKAKTLYTNNITITAESVRTQQPIPVTLSPDDVADLTFIARQIYGIYKEVGRHTMLPPLLLDALSRCTYYLKKETVDVDKIMEISGLTGITYNKTLNALEFDIRDPESGESIDYYVGHLTFLDRFFATYILPKLQKLKYRIIQFRVNGHPMSLGGIATSTFLLEKPIAFWYVSAENPLSAEDVAGICHRYNTTETPADLLPVKTEKDLEKLKSILIADDEDTDVYALSN